MLTRLNTNARIVLCGAMSAYNSSKPPGLNNYVTLISMRARIQGFIVYVSIFIFSVCFRGLTQWVIRFDYTSEYPKAVAEMSKWISEGRLKRKYHIKAGLEKCPEHLQLLFRGENTGKL